VGDCKGKNYAGDRSCRIGMVCGDVQQEVGWV